MVDINNLVKQLNELNNIAGLSDLKEKVSAALSQINDKLTDSALKAHTSADEIENLKNQQKGLQDVLNKTTAKLLEVGGAFANMADWSKIAGDNSSGGLKEILGTVRQLGNSMTANIMPAIKQNVGLFAVHKNAWIRDIVNPSKDFKRLTTGDGIFAGMNEALKNILGVQNIARTGFIALGKSIDSSNRAAENFPQLMRQSAMSTGLTKEELKDYNEAVKMVPEALDTASESLLDQMGLQRQQVQTSALAAVAVKAWGMTASQGAQMQNEAFMQLGRKGEEYIRMLGEIHGAVKSGIIPQKEAVSQIMRASESMGIFGRQASLATNVWKTFSDALTAGGVNAKHVGDIIANVTQGIANMGVENRAFIGMMSGMFQGATALGGALRMELAMRTPGGLEQNLGALTSTLKRFGGGNIITLQQAAQNPQLEMQFVLQRQMLGKLSGITSTEQQNRVLEVLQGVQRGGISRIEGSKELSSLMKRGGNVQQSMLTSLERMERIVGDNMLSAVNNMSGNIDQALSVFQRVGGLQAGAANVWNTAAGRAGQVGAIAGAGDTQTAMNFNRQATEKYVNELKNFFSMNRLAGETPRERSMHTITTGTPSRQVARAFVEGLMTFAQQMGNRIPHLEPARIPRQPRMAMLPAQNMGMASGTIFGRRTDVNEQLNQAVRTFTNEKNSLLASKRDLSAVSLTTSSPGTTNAGNVGAVGPTAIPQISKTESTITIRVISDQKDLEKKIMSRLPDEISKFINGEPISK